MWKNNTNRLEETRNYVTSKLTKKLVSTSFLETQSLVDRN